MILNQKRTHTTVAFYNGADALHANAVSRFMRYRNAVFKWNMIPTGVFYLQKESAAPFVELHINAAGCSGVGKRLTGMQGIFQRIGEQDAQVSVRCSGKSRERPLYIQGNTGFFCPPGKRRKDQIGGLIFTVPLHLLGFNLLTDAGYIGLCLFFLSVFDAGGQILQMVAQVMAVLAGQGLGLL